MMEGPENQNQNNRDGDDEVAVKGALRHKDTPNGVLAHAHNIGT